MAKYWIIIAMMFGLSPAGSPAAASTNSGAAANTLAPQAMRLLKTECFGCHNPEKKKGGLVLTSRETMLSGGDEGAVVTVGKPDESRLLSMIAATGDPHMPPKKQLSDLQIALLRDWIKAGLPWDGSVLKPQPVRLGPLPANYAPTMALALSADQSKLAAARGGRLTIYDVASSNSPVLTAIQATLEPIESLAFSPDGKTLAAGAFSRVILWSGDQFNARHEITNGIAAHVSALKFSPGTDQLFLADNDPTQSGYVRVIDTKTGEQIGSWRAHSDSIYGMDISTNGERLATASGDRLIRIWNIADRKEIATLEGHSAQVLAVAFNSNATQVVSAGTDKELKVWDIATHEKIITLGKHSAGVSAVAWPGDGKKIFAAEDDGTVLSYSNLKRHSGEQSSATGDERKIGEAGDDVFCFAVSGSGKIFAGTHDGSIHIWNSDGKSLQKLAAPVRPADSSAPLAEEPKVPELQFARFTPAPDLKRRTVIALLADPPELLLSPDSPRRQVLIGAQLSDGVTIDVTDFARYSDNFSPSFEFTLGREIAARRAGQGTLTAYFGGKHVDIPIKVSAIRTNAAQSVSFLRDVLPVLSKAGCNAGACHAKADGQNGFKLSVFSYDPKSDYHEIVREARSRRVYPAAPDESLIIKKPTTAVPHEGGLRFEPGSETYQLLVRWLRAGMPYTVTNEPVLQSIEVFPKMRRYPKGATQRLLVQARYSDDSTRDVTRLAGFDSNDKEMAKVDDRGVVSIGTLPGQTVVVARYMGFVADSHILIPSDRVLPAAQYAKLPRNNFIDDFAYAQFQKLGLYPSQLCTDAEFIRRAKLDAVGLLPSPEEVRAFLSDTSPDKRQRFIREVLEQPAYADYWANKWADLVRPNPDRVGVKSVFVLDQWLRESFRANKPYDQFVREILLAEGSNHRYGPAVIYRDRREPPELTTMFSQLFLGTRLECAKCHHHPNEKWSQDDFYQFAAFFGSVKQKGAGLSPPISAGKETFYFAPGGAVKHPVSGETMSPRALDASTANFSDGVDPRRALADWLLNTNNPFFARAAVNRIWANFFGRGFVEPVDDFRISNPCVNPELLDRLARDFAEHGYDLKHLMRRIMESRLYQLSSIANEHNLADTKNFSRAYRRRLGAEVLMDAVNDATGVPSTFAAMPAASRAMQTWSYKIESHFLDSFGRPNPSSDCPCERDTHLSVVQSLHLMNSKELQSKLSNANGRARKLADSDKTPEEIVNELYLATLSRFPKPDELSAATAAFSAKDATRRTATEDVLWALLNSAEFVLNH